MKNKQYFTTKEIEEFFSDWKEKPTGLFLEDYVYKEHRDFITGSFAKIKRLPSPIKIFGFFRGRRVYCIYEKEGIGKGWISFNEIEK